MRKKQHWAPDAGESKNKDGLVDSNNRPRRLLQCDCMTGKTSAVYDALAKRYAPG